MTEFSGNVGQVNITQNGDVVVDSGSVAPPRIDQLPTEQILTAYWSTVAAYRSVRRRITFHPLTLPVLIFGAAGLWFCLRTLTSLGRESHLGYALGCVALMFFASVPLAWSRDRLRRDAAWLRRRIQVMENELATRADHADL
jgi:hypothetical protein